MKLWPRANECRLNTAGKMLRIRIGLTRSMSYAVIKSLVRRADGHRFQFVARLGIAERDFPVRHFARSQIVTNKAVADAGIGIGWLWPGEKSKVERIGSAIPDHVLTREMKKSFGRKLSFPGPMQIFQHAFQCKIDKTALLLMNFSVGFDLVQNHRVHSGKKALCA